MLFSLSTIFLLVFCLNELLGGAMDKMEEWKNGMEEWKNGMMETAKR
jgi:hypothetical protein